MPPAPSQHATGVPGADGLIRGMGLGSAAALNMIDMVGVGPFITIPLIVGAIGGPQAILGWIVGALFCICDGMVWSELGAALPGSGGSYRYLREAYGPDKWGRLLSFLFIWQLSFSAPLSVASGCVGLARYAGYLWPKLDTAYTARDLRAPLPLIGTLEARYLVTGGTFVAIAAILVAVFLLYRRITVIGRLTKLLWVGVFGTILWIIVAGFTHFNAHLAFSFPAGAFSLTPHFFTGLGSAMLITAYDYWGYYNVCYVGDEIRDPGKNIPRAVLISILVIGCLYILMNVSILGVIPWQELDAAAKADSRFYIVSVFMQRIYGNWAGYLVTGLVIWTAFASIFSTLLGYSRVPYVAALDGNYFKVFARIHPQGRFPYVSLLALGGVAVLFCFLRLADIIAALVVIRIMIQFLVQAVGVMVLRARRPDLPRPFRMWLYPLPALIAICGFVFILVSRPDFLKEVRYATLILIVGVAIYLLRSWRRQDWPFRGAEPQKATALNG